MFQCGFTRMYSLLIDTRFAIAVFFCLTIELLCFRLRNVQMCESVSLAIVAHNNQMFALEIAVDPYGSRRPSPGDTLIIDSLRPFSAIFPYCLLHLNCCLVLAAAAAAVLVYSIFEWHSR